MTRKAKYKVLLSGRIFILCLVCLIALAPFYVAVCYAFKSKVEIAQTQLAFPTRLYLGNFAEAIGLSNYFNSFKNSILVAALVILIVVLSCSTAAYIIARKRTKIYNAIYYIFQLIILLPFQTIMFPLYRQLYDIHALNTLWGLVLVQAGSYVGYNVFLYCGFVKGISVSLEEAAMIDGCSRYQAFSKIVFPLLKPIHMTVIILTFLNSWNDFMMPMIICQKEEVRTLPLMQYFFFGQYSSNINLAFAAAILAMIPTILVYFCAQKYIVAGMTAGAVKS